MEPNASEPPTYALDNVPRPTSAGVIFIAIVSVVLRR